MAPKKDPDSCLRLPINKTRNKKELLYIAEQLLLQVTERMTAQKISDSINAKLSGTDGETLRKQARFTRLFPKGDASNESAQQNPPRKTSLDKDKEDLIALEQQRKKGNTSA